MTTMKDLEPLAERFSATREALAGTLMAHEEEKRELAKRYLPRIKKLVMEARTRRTELHQMVEISPHLFVKPRSVTLHGIRLGFQKAKGVIEWDDEAQVVKRIRALLPREQADLIIRVKESVHKPAVYDLLASDLKRLGIRIVGDGDEVVIKDASGELDKLVEALMREDVEEAGA